MFKTNSVSKKVRSKLNARQTHSCSAQKLASTSPLNNRL